MIGTLTIDERQIRIGLSEMLAASGLAVAGAARHGPMALPGVTAMIRGYAFIFVTGGSLRNRFEPLPDHA